MYILIVTVHRVYKTSDKQRGVGGHRRIGDITANDYEDDLNHTHTTVFMQINDYSKIIVSFGKFAVDIFELEVRVTKDKELENFTHII